MASADNGTVAITAASVVASFGGVDMTHFAIGAGCYMVGAVCRFGMKIGKDFESNLRPKWGSCIGALSVAPLLAAFASMVTFFGAKIVGFEGDAAIGTLLALAGFRGVEGIQWIVSTVSRFIPEKLGGDPKPEKAP
jgi:hypothetical protein